jgi:xanthine dehydrogenase accessory factor
MPKYSVDAQTLEKLKRERGRFVCARITAKRGSAPRGKGACIFICESGNILGTVGGGKWEANVIADAKAILSGKSDIKNKTYTSEGIGVICGGEMDIEFRTEKSEK